MTSRAAEARDLWLGFLIPPGAWLAELGLSYAMVPFRHGGGSLAGRLLVALVTLAAAAGGALLSLRNLRRLGERAAAHAPGRRLLAELGLAGGLFFALVIAAQGFPNLVLEPWEQP